MKPDMYIFFSSIQISNNSVVSEDAIPAAAGTGTPVGCSPVQYKIERLSGQFTAFESWFLKTVEA
jgi:hypothetical protein